MEEIKVNLSIVLPGSVMLSKEECLKTTQKTVEKKSRTGKVYKKTIEVLEKDLDKLNKHTMKVTDKDGKNPEVISFYTRKTKPATQSINISATAYKYMTDKNSCPSWVKPFQWANMSKKTRLESHLHRIMENCGGISYTYQIFDD